jgi:thiol-disulfide isomerase/thioredoxin
MPNNGANRATKSIFLFLKPEEQIKIDGKMNESYLEYTINGSEFNNANSLIREKSIKILADNFIIQTKIDSLNNIKADQKLITELYQEINKNSDIERKEQLKYISNNLNKDLSAYLLTYQNNDVFEEFYNTLSAEVKDGYFKKSLEMKLQISQNNVAQQKSSTNINIGDVALEFTLKSSSDKSFSLSSISDKYIVIDFWGTWCQPCVKGLPRMNEYYTKYKSKLEFIGIACNDNETKWKKSIEENKLEYIQLLNNLDTKIDVTLKYGVTSFPTKLILDQDKKVIARFNEESDEFYIKLDEIMKHN